MTPKQEQFAHALVATADPKTAVALAGYSTPNPQKASTKAYELRNHPSVARKIEQLLAAKFPDHESSFARVLQRQFEKAMSGEMRDGDVQKLLEMYSNLFGHMAPKTSQSLKVTAKAKTPMGSLGGDE